MYLELKAGLVSTVSCCISDWLSVARLRALSLAPPFRKRAGAVTGHDYEQVGLACGARRFAGLRSMSDVTTVRLYEGTN